VGERDPSAPDDVEPLVVLDDEADLAALPAAPALSSAAQEYLRAQGITDERTWAAFRLEHVDAATQARFGFGGQWRLRPEHGISIPTFDPRDPGTITGIIRQCYGQNQHRFVTDPVGLAGPADLAHLPRVVLTTAPLTAMRLHQDGVLDVALVEDLAALAPLRPWLAEREVILAVHKLASVAPMRTALGPQGDAAQVVMLAMAGGMSASVRAILGAVPPPPPAPAPPISLHLLRDLHRSSEGRLQTAAGLDALRAADLADPDLVLAYRIGYLPDTIHSSLTAEQKRSMSGKHIGNVLVIPAFDAAGVVVDLVTVQARTMGHVTLSLWDEPRGLCAPVLTTAHDHLVVTDMPRWLGRLWRQRVPTLLLRGAANARQEAQRIAAGGVRLVNVRGRDAVADIKGALRAAGITVGVDQAATGVTMSYPLTTATRPDEVAPSVPESVLSALTATVPVPVPVPEIPAAQPPEPAQAPATPAVASAPASPAAPRLELVSHDVATELAIFRFGAVTYRVQIPWGASTTVAVVVERGDRRQRDRLDLAVVAQRLRFASCAASRVSVTPAEIATALALLLPALQELAAPVEPVRPSPVTAGLLTIADQTTGLAALRDPDLLPQVVADLGALGCVGDPDAVAMVWLAAISRLGEEPLWLVLTAATASERFPALDLLATITPPEHLVHVSRLTDQALFNAAPDALRHKLLLLDDAAAISPSVATALRILHARGSLSGTQVERDPIQGSWRTRFVAAHGPISVITATAGTVPELMSQHMVAVPMDEHPDHALAAQRQRVASPRQRTAAASVTRLHHLQRLLEPKPVIVPAEERIDLPPPVARHRILRDACFSLIAASAILHQHQRLSADGHLVATAADIATATRLVMPLAARYLDDLSPRAHLLLTALRPLGSVEFTMDEVAQRTPSWPRTTRRRALDDLLDADCVAPLRGHQGQRRAYRLLSTTYDAGSSELGHLATPGHGLWPSANPQVANG
jgi:hypothetical protein